MIYTEHTKKALKLCFEAHKNQIDKSGMPYVFHPFHLAEQMTDEVSTVVALLHDVVEDTDYTFDDLLSMGFPTQAIDALKLLTHDDGTPYMEYVERLSSNPTARAVKLADLRHNSDFSRLETVDERARKRREKYLKAIELLEAIK
ncbi:MAG: GTP pyrophosphokinase [Clostridia bacterium]|nr:GTP pyrophosphokinase [Clostridia bacterium]